MESTRRHHFDGWTLQRASGELVNGSRRFRLQDQPLQILTALLASPGEVVSREQLIALLWPKGIVDFDIGLNSAVRKLRSALGDEADTPRYIETLPRKGYRFIGTFTPSRPGVAPHLEGAHRHGTAVAGRPWSVVRFGGRRRPPSPGCAAWPGHGVPPFLSTSTFSVPLGAHPSMPFRRHARRSPNHSPCCHSSRWCPQRGCGARAWHGGYADHSAEQSSGREDPPAEHGSRLQHVDQDPIAAGRELQVGTVLDGSIQLDQTAHSRQRTAAARD